MLVGIGIVAFALTMHEAMSLAAGEWEDSLVVQLYRFAIRKH